MNSTPNYGYETQISAISAIDRDIKRVEDKANANTAAIVENEKQVLINKKDIECLSKQKYKSYTKCETDNLLSNKVDKKDGFGLISDDCLHQICTNKGDISLLEGYITELQEQNAYLKNYIDSELSNKANRTPPIEYDFPFCQGFKKYKKCSYYMTQENQVVLNLAVEAEQDFTGYDLIGILPAGFRPDEMIEAPGAVSGGAFATFGIYPDGSVRLLLHGKVGENPYAYTSSIVYRVAHQ